MEEKKKIDTKFIIFGGIVLVCILALTFAIYFQIFGKDAPITNTNTTQTPIVPPEETNFDDLFDNKINLQGFDEINSTNKLEPTKELVYTTFSLNEIYEGKYEINANIPLININNERIMEMDREILTTFYNKITEIIDNSAEEQTETSIYNVAYSAYLNENILSVVIKATLKEGTEAQRVMIKEYNYNISTNQEVSLKEIMEIRNVSSETVQNKINETIQAAINYSENLASLGYESYKRNIKNDMYKVENSKEYFLGPNRSIYIIYAYGNNEVTTESDIVCIQ